MPATGAAQWIIGHRGASHDAPENTVTAFQEAWRQSADGVEGDFYFTLDKQIVCIHDHDTQRTAGKKLDVAGSTLAQLRQLEVGGWKAAKYAGEPIPTLQDVLQCVPTKKRLVIELKTGPAIVPLLKRELDQFQRANKEAMSWDQLLIISFDADTVARAKRELPQIKAHWLTGYQQDKTNGPWHPTAAEISRQLRDCHADGLGTQANRDVVTAEFIDQLRQQGLKEFHVWTVDDVEDAAYFRDLGAMAITTNRPGYLRQSLQLQ